MKKLIITTIILLNVSFANIMVNDDMSSFKYPDQYDKIHEINNDTKALIFAFKKASAHLVNALLKNKDNTYLSSKNIYYVADVSAMPTIIKWFALPSLKDYKFPILVFDNEELSAKYKDERNVEKIMFVVLENKIVKEVKYFDTAKQLENYLEK